MVDSSLILGVGGLFFFVTRAFLSAKACAGPPYFPISEKVIRICSLPGIEATSNNGDDDVPS